MIDSSSSSRSWLITIERAAVGAQEVEQPVAGVVVEVVGGLVEHEQLAAREQDAGQLDPPALAARQHGDRPLDPVAAQAEAGEQAAGLGLGRVPAGVLERVVRPAPLGHQALVAGLGLHLEAQLLEPLRRARRGPRPPSTWASGGARRAGCGRAGGPGAGSRTAPGAGSRRPWARPCRRRTLSSDVLPAPLRPTSPTRSPARTVKAAPSTTRVPPTSTVRPRTDNMADHRGRPAAPRSTLHSTRRARWP